MTKIAIIVGSTRPGRKADAVAAWVHQIAERRGDAQFEVVDIADFNLPLLVDVRQVDSPDSGRLYSRTLFSFEHNSFTVLLGESEEAGDNGRIGLDTRFLERCLDGCSVELSRQRGCEVGRWQFGLPYEVDDYHPDWQPDALQVTETIESFLDWHLLKRRHEVDAGAR